MNDEVKVLYFASLRDKLGVSEESIKLDEPLSVHDIKDILLERGGVWDVFSKDNNILSAINQVICKDKAKINNGDELAFFPPVTGG